MPSLRWASPAASKTIATHLEQYGNAQLGLGTVVGSAVPVIAFHAPVSGVSATAPLASCLKTSSFMEP